jgi:PAS domain S-box-containing protein
VNRTLLGAAVAVASVGLTYVIEPLRLYPLLLAFPAVLLSGWFLGMAGSFGCAVVDVALIDVFLTEAQFSFSTGIVEEEIRLSLFFILSTLLGVLIRRWAQQREQLSSQELRKSLILEQTQRQMAEERTRSAEKLSERNTALNIALRASGMGLWTWDLQHNTVHWTDEIYKIMGYETRAFEPDNEIWLGCIHHEDAKRVRDGLNQAVHEGKDFFRQYRIIAKNGSVRWVESQGQCQRDKDGRPTWIMGVLTDITVRKQMQESMLQAEKLAVAGRLAASVAHEINNPLEAVTNLLFLVTLSKSAEEAHQHARNALDELLRVSMITQSTLKFHRQPGAPKITMLSEVVEGVIQMYRARLKASEIIVDVETSNEVAIECMPTEAQQIFANLMANSIDAMLQSGRLLIRVRASRDWRNRSIAGMRVSFCDSGSGIDRETMRHIFEPFFSTKPDTGTGLGLWVVAQLVARHNGHVRVWSRQRTGASGTVFSIFLPTAQAVADSRDDGSSLGTTLADSTSRRAVSTSVRMVQ